MLWETCPGNKKTVCVVGIRPSGKESVLREACPSGEETVVEACPSRKETVLWEA